MRVGPRNHVQDVAGIRVGHHQRVGHGWLTGTTCLLLPDGGAVAGVDVRGGAPGTRETDLLDPRAMIERVDAVVFSGGSAFGLAAADGVMDALAQDGVGFQVGGPGEVVPIVPAAVVFDLSRGGDYVARPDADFGRVAYADAMAGGSGSALVGCVGAGTGTRVGDLKGGVGGASAVLDDGVTVAALVVANAAGSAVDGRTGELYAARFGLEGEFADLHPHPRPETASPAGHALWPGRATTLALVATDATLTKAQCQKMAGIGHDGLARAVRPVHTMYDGDAIFGAATGARPAPDGPGLHAILTAAADCVTRAIGHALLEARQLGGMPTYREVHLDPTR